MKLGRKYLSNLQHHGGGSVVAPVVYVGNDVGGNSMTYASAPIGTASASRVVVVCFHRDSAVGSSTTSITCGGVALTLWTPGAYFASGASYAYMEIWYGVVPTGTTANIVAVTVGTISNLMSVYSVYGCSSTPLDQVSQTSQTDANIELSDVETKVSGAAIFFGLADRNGGAITFTESWTGAGTLIEDMDRASNSANWQAMSASIATVAASTTDDFVATISASRAHLGGAISFGP